MSKIKVAFFISIVFLVHFFYGCNATVNISKPEQQKIQDWTNEDSQTVVDSLVKQLTDKDWIANLHGKKSKVVVGKILNKTGEKINTELIEKNVERKLLNDGRFSFIPSKAKLEVIRTKRKHSSDFPDNKKFKKYLISLKTNFFIEGKLNLITDSLKNSLEKKYILSLTVINAKKGKITASDKITVIK